MARAWVQAVVLCLTVTKISLYAYFSFLNMYLATCTAAILLFIFMIYLL